jgi:hypothetical protein
MIRQNEEKAKNQMVLKKGVKKMKVTLEFVIRDDKGNIPSQNSPLTLEIGTQGLHDIEGGVEEMKQKVLPEIEATLLTQAQNEFTKKVKKK